MHMRFAHNIFIKFHEKGRIHFVVRHSDNEKGQTALLSIITG